VRLAREQSEFSTATEANACIVGGQGYRPHTR
jgi:hypothetical protein